MTKGDLVFLYDTLYQCSLEVRREERLELIGQSLSILEKALDNIGIELGHTMEILDEQESEDTDLRHRDEAESGLCLDSLQADHWDQSDQGAWEDDMLGGEVA